MTSILIIGGGIVGCALAREAARRGATVTLLEARGAVGEEASGAAIGTLAYSPTASMPPAWHTLASRALASHHELCRALADEVEDRPAWHWPGQLNVATNNRSEKYARERFNADRAAGQPGEWLDKRALRAREPSLGGAVQGGSYTPGHGWVDGGRLTRALARAAIEYGATVRVNTPVTGLLWEGEGVRGAVAGGEAIRAERTVIAAGTWSGRLDPRLPAPVEPVRGQAIELDLTGTGLSLPVIRHYLMGSGVYLIPSERGVLIGSTHERAGFRKGATAAGVAKLLWNGLRLVPALGRAAWERASSWSGLRPATPDNLPILGADPRIPGLWWATGHFRSGILLAPLTATLLADALLEGREIDPRLSAGRFG